MNTVLAIYAALLLQLWPFPGPGRAPAGGSPSYIVNEGFEGTGNPGSWTTSGTIDFDESTTYKDGAQSAEIDSTSATGYIRPPDFSGVDDLYGKFWVYTDHLTNAASVQLVDIANGGTVLASVKILGSSDCLYAVATNNGFMTTGCILPTNTWIRVWFHYTKGSGSNATMRVWWATTDTHPGNGDTAYYAVRSDGTATAQATRITFYSANSGTENGIKYYDSIQLSSTILW